MPNLKISQLGGGSERGFVGLKRQIARSVCVCVNPSANNIYSVVEGKQINVPFSPEITRTVSTISLHQRNTPQSGKA